MLLFFTQVCGASLGLASTGHFYSFHIYLAQLILGILVVFIAYRIPPIDSSGIERSGERTLSLFSIALVFLLGLCLLVTGVIVYAFYPNNTDDLWYHLPMVYSLIERGNLVPIGIPIVDTYPKIAELWFAWLSTVVGGDFLVDGAQVPFFFMGLAAVYCISIESKFSRRAAAIAALASGFAPVVFAQLSTAHVDIAVSGLFLAAIALLLVAKRSDTLTSFLLFGLACGLLAGTKISGAVLSVLLCTMLFIIRCPWKRFATVAVISTMMGARSYIYNFLAFGNPLYPYKVPTFGLAGPFSEETMWITPLIQDMGFLEKYYISWFSARGVGETSYGWYVGGLGVMWPLMIACIAASTFFAFKERGRELISLHSLFLVAFILSPLNFSPRFVLFVLGWGGLALAHCLTKCRAGGIAETVLASVTLTAAVITANQTFQRARFETKDLRTSRSETCRDYGKPDSYRPLFEYVQNSDANRIVIFGAGKEPELAVSFACFWSAANDRKVIFSGSSESEIVSILQSSEKSVYASINDAISAAEFEKFARGRGGEVQVVGDGVRYFEGS